MTYIFMIVVISIVLIWFVWGIFSSRVEKAEYSVLETKTGYEIRLYPAHIVAQTTVKGPYKEALNEGFRIIARYIFGGNTKKQSITMTAPVLETKSESINMTAPVTATIEGEYHTITFGMPKSYTLETLPTPNDSRVEIVTIPEKKMAVLRFSWFRNSERIQSKKQELIDLLKNDGIATIGEPQYAGYNGPWTPPWMNRHEVLVEVK